MIALFMKRVKSEEQSLLKNAVVLDVVLFDGSSSKENLHGKSYKARVITDGAEGPYGDYSAWFTIDQGTSQNCTTVFLVPNVHSLTE